jgi:phosphopantothenoylcysteine decarboxylase/phosphopantothenate--cysteine ligase
MLIDKNIVLGVTGGIAAYKAADLASKLTQEGADVDVVMTESAMEFISPITFRALTHRPVVTSMFELSSEFSMEHIALSEAADVVVIAPATANTIAKLAAGIADDMLTCTVLATEAPVIVVPAMNVNMWQNSITQENIAKLKARGFIIVDPEYGRLASGRMGMGRFAKVGNIIGTIKQVLGRNGDLARRRIVVTAGGTREAIDPVRYIGNRSSGKMGYALAEAARDRGAVVTLITAPTALPIPAGIDSAEAETVAEMRTVVLTACESADVLIMAAAISDFRVAQQADQKIKKQGGKVSLELVETEDFLLELPDTFIKIGFAAETENLLKNAQKKLDEKRLGFICANDVTAADSGFGTDTNKVTLLFRDGRTEDLPLMSKREVADIILDRVVAILEEKA